MDYRVKIFVLDRQICDNPEKCFGWKKADFHRGDHWFGSTSRGNTNRNNWGVLILPTILHFFLSCYNLSYIALTAWGWQFLATLLASSSTLHPRQWVSHSVASRLASLFFSLEGVLAWRDRGGPTKAVPRRFPVVCVYLLVIFLPAIFLALFIGVHPWIYLCSNSADPYPKHKEFLPVHIGIFSISVPILHFTYEHQKNFYWLTVEWVFFLAFSRQLYGWPRRCLTYETSSQSSVDAIAKQKNCKVIEVLGLLGLEGEQDRAARRSDLVEYQATWTGRK